jgi:chemotaxis protein histidine kinase CheA
VTRSDDELDAAIAQLWERWRGEMMRRVGLVADATTALAEGRLDTRRREDAASAAHKIAGTAGSFGFVDASRYAREIETALKSGADGPDAPHLAGLATAIKAAFEAGPPRDPD